MEEGGLPRSLAFTAARGGDVGAREDVGVKAKRRSEVGEGASGRGGREHASGLGGRAVAGDEAEARLRERRRQMRDK
jgi:hypothetical protein